jgi:thiamine biosynthesis protein ThiI
VHYDEIALKGGNRRQFEACLERNLRASVRGLGDCRVRRKYGRFLLRLSDSAPIDEVCRRLARVVGIARFSPCVRIEPKLEAAKERVAMLVDRLLEEGKAPASFAIATRRARKDLSFSSMDANRELGSLVVEKTGWKVQLKDPELPIHVWFVDNDAFVAVERLAGPGGLPSGSNGRVACLLSGGIDSPVSTYRIIKRGTEVVLIHFHSFPHTSAASQDKVRELASQILQHGKTARLHMVPFASTQQRIITECPAPLRVILYRRYMIRAAEAIARKERALALVTGDSLGQVASQTLENLDTIQQVTKLPILRPLIGMHKAEIIEDARRIGTYDTSIEPHDDCCSFLMPPKPATRSTPAQLDAAEEALDTEAEIRELLERTEVEEIEGGGALGGVSPR